MWPTRLRRLTRSIAVSSPGRRFRSRLARFAAVSQQEAPCSKLMRLPDPAASSHQFLYTTEVSIKFKTFISDSATTPRGVQSGHAPTL